MKKLICLIVLVALVSLSLTSCLALLLSDSENVDNQETGVPQTIVENNTETNNAQPSTKTGNLGKYNVVIDSCRLSVDLTDKPIVIVKYIFTNVDDDDAASFMFSLSDNVFQDGIGLNKSYFVDSSENYSSDNQTKELKKGATLEVEVAYELNNTTSSIDVEVSELISFNDKKVTKTFALE